MMMTSSQGNALLRYIYISQFCVCELQYANTHFMCQPRDPLCLTKYESLLNEFAQWMHSAGWKMIRYVDGTQTSEVTLVTIW